MKKCVGDPWIVAVNFGRTLKGLGDNVLVTDVDLVLDSGSSTLMKNQMNTLTFIILLDEHARNLFRDTAGYVQR